MKYLLVVGCFVILSSAIFCDNTDNNIFPQCSEHIQLVGCFKDGERARYVPEDRLIPHEAINARDYTNPKFIAKVGLEKLGIVDWKNFKTWLPDFICDCAKKAVENGDTLFGMQFWGECWTGNDDSDYERFGAVDACFTNEYRDALNAREQCMPAIGTKSVNYVYRVKPQRCPLVDFKPVGCYHDAQEEPRPLRHYIMTERDYSRTDIFNGHLIDWSNWKSYNPALICRCATKAKEMGFHYFGIQFWGECWADYAGAPYFKDGPSHDCYDEEFKQTCDCTSYNCVGKAKTNYVYELAKSSVPPQEPVIELP